LEPETHVPKTILFFSVDIAGATRFKESAQSVSGGASWLQAFETFFRELPLVVMGQVAVAFADADDIPEIGIWKALGDELIFRAEPKSATEAAMLVEACYRALVRYDERFADHWPLRLRGCCWAARFPGRNIEVAIREIASEDGRAHLDYIGPDVDLGFRLSGHAHHGQMAVSMNLAEALARLPDRWGLQFHFVGKRQLKGVFMGRPYPVLLATLADCMPDPWEWEAEDAPQLAAVRDSPPMPTKELLELADRIRTYMNRMSGLGLEPLSFG
jgi:class 3 adenylate cyclase